MATKKEFLDLTLTYESAAVDKNSSSNEVKMMQLKLDQISPKLTEILTSQRVSVAEVSDLKIQLNRLLKTVEAQKESLKSHKEQASQVS
jgi:hypothetical protein